MTSLTLRVNEVMRAVETDDPDTPLLYVLRNDLGPISVSTSSFTATRGQVGATGSSSRKDIGRWRVVADPPGG